LVSIPTLGNKLNSETEIDIGLIQGVMFGIEFPPLMEVDPDVKFAMAIDIGIVRVTVIRWKIVD
jgi:hypothetical protein